MWCTQRNFLIKKHGYLGKSFLQLLFVRPQFSTHIFMQIKQIYQFPCSANFIYIQIWSGFQMC